MGDNNLHNILQDEVGKVDLGKLAELLQAAKDQGYVAGDVSVIVPQPPTLLSDSPPQEPPKGEEEERHVSTF